MEKWISASKNELSIPVSGIAYTREILGKTDSLTQIQALYGHNEAAVNSLLPLDTFYAYPDGSSHQVIRPKENRLIASGRDFITQPNPKNLSQKASLPQDKVKLLQRVSKQIHDHYGLPMDIEWVWDRMKDILYVVQARDLVERFPPDPETVDTKALENAVPNASSHPSEMIISVRNKVALVKDPKEVLSDTTLAQAFDRFMQLAKENKHEGIQLVIVKQHAAATSHAACTLREMGVDICFCPSFNDSWLQSENSFIAVDPQKDLLIAGTEFPIDTSAVIKKGWFRHPIAAVETVQNLAPFSFDEVDKFVDLFFSGKDRHTEELGLEELRLLFDQMGSSETKEVILATWKLIRFISQQIQELKSDHLQDRGALLLRNAVKIGERVLNKKLPQLERLHAAKRLQALILQEGSLKVIDNDSLLQILKEKQILSTLELPPQKPLSTEEQKSLDIAIGSDMVRLQGASQETMEALKSPLTEQEAKTALAIYKVMENSCISEESKACWNQFTSHIGASRSRYANRLLLNLLEEMGKADVTAEWINLLLPDSYKGPSVNAVEILVNQAKVFERSRSSMKWLEEQKKLIDRFNEKESSWSDPVNFDKLFKEFEEFESALKSASLRFQRIPEEDLLAKSAYTKFIKEGIDLYDRSIKSLRGSPHYTDKNLQAENFQKMLLGYVQLSQYWVKKIPDKTIENWTIALRSQSRTGDLREIYNQSVRAQMKHIKADPSQLYPSQHFLVASRVINSASAETTMTLANCTLEDIFMLVHQNALAALDAVFHPPWEKSLPELLRKLEVEVKKTFNKDLMYVGKTQANLLSCNLRNKTIDLTYNVPLKYHSATIFISYEKMTGKTILEMKILGHNLGSRMNEVIDNLIFKCLIQESKFTKTPSYNKASEQLSVSWELDLEDESSSSFVLNTILEAFNDSILGVRGSTKLSDKYFENLDHHKLETLYKKPLFKAWIENGAPYFFEVIARIDRKFQDDFVISMFKELGFNIPSSDESRRMRMLRGILDALNNPHFFEGSQQPIQLICRYMQHRIVTIEDEGFNSFLQEHSFSQRSNYPESLNYIMKQLQEWSFTNLLDQYSSDSSSLESIIAFLDQMKDNNQVHFFYDKFSHLNSINLPEKEKLITYFQEVMKNHSPPEGWKPPNEWVASGDFLTEEQVKVGDPVLRWDGENWNYGRIIKPGYLEMIDEGEYHQIFSKDTKLRPFSALKIP